MSVDRDASGSRRAPLTRRQNWPARLEDVLTEARGKPFAWGEHDCCLLAAEVVDAMCDTRIAARFRGRYKTARGARGLFSRLGGPDRLRALAGPEIPVRLAQRGDVVALPAPVDPDSAGIMLGICIGEQAAGAGPRGLILVPMRHATRAWAAGRPGAARGASEP